MILHAHFAHPVGLCLCYMRYAVLCKFAIIRPRHPQAIFIQVYALAHFSGSDDIVDRLPLAINHEWLVAPGYDFIAVDSGDADQFLGEEHADGADAGIAPGGLLLVVGSNPSMLLVQQFLNGNCRLREPNLRCC